MKQSIFSKIRYRYIFLLYLIITVLITIQLIVPAQTKDFGNGILYTHYNNFQIFKYSFYNLLEGVNLYIHHPEQYFDLYKYTPTFSLLFGFIAWLPDSLGLFLWNALNAGSLLFAIYYLPYSSSIKKIILLLCLPELAISLQNAQSNALMAAMVLLGVLCMEQQKNFWAACLFVACGFLKVYGGIAFLFFLFYPNKIKFLSYCVFWTVLLFILPLLATSWTTLLFQYQEWFKMMGNDQSASTGLSVLGILSLLFQNIEWAIPVYILGLICLIMQFYFTYRQPTKINIWFNVGLLLIWMIIFNHKAESPTYIVSLLGIFMVLFQWYNFKTAFIIALVCMVITSLTPGDLFPKIVHEMALKTWLLKAWPSIAFYFFGLVLLGKKSLAQNRPTYSS